MLPWVPHRRGRRSGHGAGDLEYASSAFCTEFHLGGVGLGVSEEIFFVEGWVDCRSLMFWRVRCVVVVVVIVVDDGADTGGSTGGTETAQK